MLGKRKKRSYVGFSTVFGIAVWTADWFGIDRLRNGMWKGFGGRQPNMKTRLLKSEVDVFVR